MHIFKKIFNLLINSCTKAKKVIRNFSFKVLEILVFSNRTDAT